MMNDTEADYMDYWHRRRLQALQSVDEMVDGIFQRLQNHSILDNTYVIYTTDNGYHIGQHRLRPGKKCACKPALPGMPSDQINH